MSTGVASLAEISESIEVLKSAGCSQLILLKCTSTYPASPENSNLLTIPDLRSRFQTEVGLSDHTMGIGVPLAAIALGAVVIEKHFTLSRAEGGVDAAFSIEPQELKSLVDESERAWLGLGTVTYELSAGENKSREFKRSIYVSSDIRKGEPFTPNNVRVIRPAKGLLPKYYTHILGMIASRDMSKGHPLQEDDIQGFALNYDSEY
jgi:sialic acid synthase SpsE